MMSQTKDGMLYAAMMAQDTAASRSDSGRSSQRLSDESVTIANASTSVLSKLSRNDKEEAEADVEVAKEAPQIDQDKVVPFAIRRAAVTKHAEPLIHYPAPENQDPDVRKVENPPAEGVYIPQSRPRAKKYLTAPEERKQEEMKIPTALRRKDLPPPDSEQSSEDNSSKA